MQHSWKVREIWETRVEKKKKKESEVQVNYKNVDESKNDQKFFQYEWPKTLQWYFIKEHKFIILNPDCLLPYNQLLKG